MTAHEFWLRRWHYARLVFLVFMLGLSALSLSAPGHAQLDVLAANYLAYRDQRLLNLSRMQPAAAWSELATLGDMHQKHRYAELKTQVLQSLLSSDAKAAFELHAEHWQWAKKNARNIELQINLSRHLQAQGAPGRALALLQDLAWRVPEHEALTELVIELALALDQREIAQQQLQRYVLRGQLLQWHVWPLLARLQGRPELLSALPLIETQGTDQAPATTLPTTPEWSLLHPYYGAP